MPDRAVWLESEITMAHNIDNSYVEPNYDVAQLVSAEMFSPDVDGSLWFFKTLLGMTETGRDGDSVYLKAYEEFYDHSLKITYRDKPGIGATTWRSSSPQALARRVDAIETSGMKGWWNDNGDHGQGPTYHFGTPAGHEHALLWDVEQYQCPEEDKTVLGSRSQRRPIQGVPVRRLDHVNLLVDDVRSNREFMMDQMGFKLREQIVLENGTHEEAAWMSVSPLVHEVANMADQSGQSAGGNGRLHHLAFWYGYPQHLDDISDIFTERGIEIEAGPGKHGVSQAKFLYVFEPGGNRIELFGDAGYLIFDPAWKPVTWTEESLDKSIIWFGSPLPAEYFLYGTPQELASEYWTHNKLFGSLGEKMAAN